jgi:RNA polymerase sigma-70 factor (ECF subfamily)
VSRAETASDLLDALSRLPFSYRSAVVLHDAHGMTTQEVAVIQSVGLPAAKQRVRRGRMMLVSALAAGAERREALQGVPMRCWEARSKVSDYLDGELSDADRRMLTAHLDACPTCPPLVASLVGAKAALGLALQDPDSVIAPELVQRLSARPS